MSAKLKVLHHAIVSNNVEDVKKLAHTNNVNYVDPLEGLSLLSWSVTLGHVAITELLLQRGASVALSDRHGFQPIHRAVWFRNLELVNLLLAYGADAHAVNRVNHRTPLCLAAMCGSVEITKVLVAHQPPVEGIDIDYRDKSGRSALDIAAASGNHEMVAYLLTSGADAYFSRACASEGAETARTWAERRSYDEINRLLCQAWARQSQVTM